MVVIVLDEHEAQLKRLADQSTDLMLVAIEPYEFDSVVQLIDLAKTKMSEGGQLIVAPTLTDAFLLL